jgi:twinkle protein
MQYLDDPDLQLVLERVSRVIIATDGDDAGRYLGEQLSLRIGQEKCSRVEYPVGTKDANDVLIKHGAEGVIDLVISAREYPTVGVFEVDDFRDKVLRLYDTGILPGYSTGIKQLDEIITFKSGYAYIFTGVPHVGKTELLDFLTAGLAEREGIHITAFDPESHPLEEKIAKLAQLHLRIPFGKPTDQNRMSKQELIRGVEWVKQHFSWLMPERATIDEILRLAKQQILKHGTKVLIIDPFTEVEVEGDNEHQYIKKFLSKINRFAAANDVIVIVVAHPTKVEMNKDTGEYPKITSYMINGSAHWYNKGFFIISLWRSMKRRDNILRVHIEKAKVKAVGMSGTQCDLSYDDRTGLFKFIGDINEVEDFTTYSNTSKAIESTKQAVRVARDRNSETEITRDKNRRRK